MRILYNSDSHGDIPALEIFSEFAKDRDIDVVVSSGDLINGVFENENELRTYQESANRIYPTARANDNIHPVKLAQHLMQAPNCPIKLKNISITYLESLETAQERMLNHYNRVGEILERSDAHVLVSPGQYDGGIMKRAFSGSNMHKKVLELDGIRFAGYGAAYERPTWIPRELMVDFDETEAYEFLKKADADIAITHIPPYGLCDLRERDNTHQGNFAILAYMLEENPYLLLCGHMHEARGIESRDGDGVTKVINPGNLGRTPVNPHGNNPGRFVEIEVDDDGRFKEAKNYRITDFDKGLESILEEDA